MSQQQRAAQIFNELAKGLVQLSELFLVSDAPPGTTQQDEKPQKKKVEKDPNAPKRNLSSYMLYSQAVRPATAEKHPDLKAIDIAKLIGEKWNKLSDKEKQPFVKQAEKEKAKYDKENQKYKANLGEDHEVATKRKAPATAAEAEAPSKKKSKESSETKDAKNTKEQKDVKVSKVVKDAKESPSNNKGSSKDSKKKKKSKK